MSALKEILDKMYVDPELLEQLDDEQKHILFIKMREEQIRRWKLNEEKQEQLERLRPRPRSNGPRIQWLTGRDGEVWVWVMGEHPDDKPIERIIEDEAKKMAREIAENEVLMESLRMDDTLSDANLDEQALKNQLMEMELSSATNSSSPQNVSNGISSDKDVDREDQLVGRPAPTPLQTPYYASVQYALQQPSRGSPVPKALPKDRVDAPPARTSLPTNGAVNATNGASDVSRAAANYDNVDRDRRHSTGAVPPPVPAKPVHLTRRKPDAEPDFVQSTRSYVPVNKPTPVTNGTTRRSAGALPFPVTYSGQSSDEYTEVPSRTKPMAVNESAPRNGFSHDFAFRYPPPPHAPQNGSAERSELL
ncbi:SH2 domain containing protein [Aphelenchoides avenae]|nr:SH2 domain containing protein [Aphelenchus avenae]